MPIGLVGIHYQKQGGLVRPPRKGEFMNILLIFCDK